MDNKNRISIFFSKLSNQEHTQVRHSEEGRREISSEDSAGTWDLMPAKPTFEIPHKARDEPSQKSCTN